MSPLLKWLLEASRDSEDVIVACYASQTIASLANKRSNDKELQQFLEEILMKQIWGKEISSSIEWNTSVANSLRTLHWMIKALIMCDHPMGFLLSELLCEKMQSPIGSRISEGFSFILEDDDESKPNGGIFSKENHAIVKVLFKQKLFSRILPLLLRDFQKENLAPQHKTSYLLTIANLLKNVPHSVLLGELSRILQ